MSMKLTVYSGRWTISFEHDLDDYNQPSPVGSHSRIGQSQAMDAVLSRVPGASNRIYQSRWRKTTADWNIKAGCDMTAWNKFKLDAYREMGGEPDD